MDQNYWKKCSSCKKEIPFSADYYLCSVSTCKHKRKGYRFCSVPCWDAHLGFANHREAWAVEAKAPSKAEYISEQTSDSSSTRAPVRKVVTASNPQSSVTSARSTSNIKTDTLVVVSKVKKLIKDQTGFSTSQCCVDALTKKVVEECLKAAEQAKSAGRKTVMGRDVNKTTQG